MALPLHLQHHRCFVCGGEAHRETTHRFLSNEDATQEIRKICQDADAAAGVSARYVAQHRPY